MILNGQTLQATQIGFRTEFNKAFELAQPDHEMFTMQIPSTKAKEQYKWLGDLPVMHEWVAEAQFDQLRAFGFEIENKDWQTGLEIDRNDIMDDSLGLILPQIGQMGEEARRHPGELVWNLMNNGFTGLAYDGQYFFDTDHVDAGEAAQSNKMSGGGSTLTVANIRLARTAMRRYKDTKGRPLNIAPTHLCIPPELEGAAKDAIDADKLANGATNTEYKALKIHVSPYLTSATAWFLCDLSKRVKGFVQQNRMPAQFIAQDKPDDDLAFRLKKFRYQANARYNVGYGMWKCCFGSVGA